MSSIVPGGGSSEEEVDELVASLDIDGPGDDPPDAGDGSGDPGDERPFGGLLDQTPPVGGIGGAGVTYEVADWSGESRALLDSLLGSEDIPHMWQGTALTVPSDVEARVEELIDEVMATATPALEPDLPRVVYEVGEWSAALQTSLADSLAVADIPYEWNEAGDLVVYATDEEHVDEILDGMPDPDEADAGDGADAQEVLSSLFLAAGRLARAPRDAEAVLAAASAADRLESMPVPFGFEPPVWKSLLQRVTGLRAGLDGDLADGSAWSDEDVAGAAAELRDRLRRLV